MRPYLSIVFVARNESDDLLHRMQISVSMLLEQLRYHRVPSELIIVQRTPPDDRFSFAQALRWPSSSPCAVRVLKDGDADDEVAKNLGIRRAKGRYILSTSPGMIFSDHLIQFVAAQRLNPGVIYRIDRYDVPDDVPGGTVDKQLAWCEAHVTRVHTASGVFPAVAKGSFPLVENDIAIKGGPLMLGAGWFHRELDGSRPFRWFNNDAEIVIRPSSKRILAIDLEAGPGVKMGPADLDALDENGAKLLSIQLAKRQVINIFLPYQSKPFRIRLHVSNSGHHYWRDGRALNVRVFGCGLYDSAVTPRPWTLAQRVWWAATRSMGNSLLPPKTSDHDTSEHAVSLHLNTCGDFTLLARKHWFDLRGYPESDAVSGDRAALFCRAAELAGLEEHVLEFPLRAYCIGGQEENASCGDNGQPPINSENWGRAKESIEVTLAVKPRKIRWRPGHVAKVVPEVIVARVFRAIPRPPLPEPDAFVNSVSIEDLSPPLENPPKISIVTPSYQQGSFLEWTIRSVLEQNYPNLEYVVMDGGSTDETREILERYKARLTYWESAPDEGQADAVARGFQRTSGEIMAYLNSDDVFAPGALDFAARYFTEHPEADAIYSHRVFIDEQNIVTRHWILPQHSDWMMQRWDYIPQETCFWRRRIYEKAGGIDPSYRFALDYDLFVRFMKHGRMVRVNRFLGAFREHPSSKTTLQEGAHPEVTRVHREYGIRINNWHRLPHLAEFELLDVRSKKFAARGKKLPGALAGIGYDYDLVWQGRLNGHHNSLHNTAGTLRT